MIRIIPQLCWLCFSSSFIKVCTFHSPQSPSVLFCFYPKVHSSKCKNQLSQMWSHFVLIKQIPFYLFLVSPQSIRGMLQVRGDSNARISNQPTEKTSRKTQNTKKCSCGGYCWSPPSSARWVFFFFFIFKWLPPLQILLKCLCPPHRFNATHNGHLEIQFYFESYLDSWLTAMKYPIFRFSLTV